MVGMWSGLRAKSFHNFLEFCNCQGFRYFPRFFHHTRINRNGHAVPGNCERSGNSCTYTCPGYITSAFTPTRQKAAGGCVTASGHINYRSRDLPELCRRFLFEIPGCASPKSFITVLEEIHSFTFAEILGNLIKMLNEGIWYDACHGIGVAASYFFLSRETEETTEYRRLTSVTVEVGNYD